jgi:hypothetical protein
MPQEAVPLGVVATLTPPVTRWGETVLRPTAVLGAVPAAMPGAVLAEAGGARTVYLGPAVLTLHSGDTGHYRDNLGSRRPSVWVALRDGAVHLVTVDPYEGEGLAGDTALMVEALPMPGDLVARVAGFVAAHHVELDFKKRKRKPATPEADPRAPRVLRPEDKWVRR